MAGAGAAAVALVGLALAATLRSSEPETSAAASDTTQSRAAPAAQDPMIESRSKGGADAPVTVFELSDFGCPYCRLFANETLPHLEREYIDTGKIRFIFINLPLASLHPNAPAAHEFAMCAARQDRFWPVHDLLFQHQDRWNRSEAPGPIFMELADSVALDREALTSCLANREVRPVVLADLQQAQRGRITQTPTFVVEGGILPGHAPIDVWRPILDSIIQTKADSLN
jgi:protein-disulfide isomerase